MSKCKVFKHGEYVLALMGLLLGEIPKHLKYGWCVTLIVMWSERYFGPASPNPWPDCSGKRLRAPEGFLPGEHPKQPKFVILCHPKFYMSRKDNSSKDISGNAG